MSKSVHVVKFAKVRELFLKRKIRFARAEQHITRLWCGQTHFLVPATSRTRDFRTSCSFVAYMFSFYMGMPYAYLNMWWLWAKPKARASVTHGKIMEVKYFTDVEDVVTVAELGINQIMLA